ncbi:hypothetical protein [Pseudofulvimonas gallinarii]|jgi:hypothetical protein|uniref:Cytochrome oxidase Cu insertion factor (SCO1/SenC/PrrC family) n=1 Tax=Pseudofulvimonas gallinarii TaxID=634155 RepID=A0A4R3L2J4_9GAMM|nr:hypothetical protein [Pseudofulvimonas gallinarii]TCS93793.1 hypothetical protein EDC25_12548 [Pseudofulvimonas gallinarii]THD13244.1 hypothetical protein B1808_08860 [Pseudofulvimonas gallinarii]
MNRKRISRGTMIGVAVLFLTPFIVALVLNRLGWHPTATRNNGVLVQPPEALGELELRTRSGTGIAVVNPDHRFTLVVRLPAVCDDACMQRLDELYRVRYSLHRHAPRLAIALVAPAVMPDLPEALNVLDEGSVDRLHEASPRFATQADWSGLLVDDKGFLMLEFPPDLEARLMRRDLGRLIK